MKQYYALKQAHPDAILLFRVGDFYETFGEDAILSSKILGITLTKRANGSASHVELAGFPYHALDVYLPKFVRAGKRVAVCEQLEDPKATKNIVKRGVTELVTPGTSLHDKTLDNNANNFLAAVHFSKNAMGLALCDLTTGEFWVSQGSKQYVDKLIQTLQPAEVLYSKLYQDDFIKQFGSKLYTYLLDDWLFNEDYATEQLLGHFKTQNLKGFGVENYHEGVVAAGVILHYLKESKFENLGHITSLRRLEADEAVWLDKFTIRNLELVYPQHADGMSLVDVIDSTKTPMGGRLLKNWMLLPLKDSNAILKRQQIVEHFYNHQNQADDLVDCLKQIGDLERLISKVALQRVNPREVLQIKRALDSTSLIKKQLSKSENDALVSLSERINECASIRQKIENTLTDEPPAQANKGDLIKAGVSVELDEYRRLTKEGKDILVGVQQKEAENTGISTLKLGFNNVFGYYLEVRNSHKDKVPGHWTRKQTLVSAERYITDELKELEEKILDAEQRLSVLEMELYQKLIAELVEFIEPIQQNSNVVARIDVLISFAQKALENHYTKPTITNDYSIDIKAGRHPVIEQTLPVEQQYIPNEVFLSNDNQQVIILTGPNMSGKSAVLRQTALIVIMAQIGAFVPAQSASIGIVDKVFTRVGASDNLSTGESTFMVEMTETASILNNFSERSLILLDEIGRGTSTYDGVSIAWSISEYLHNHPYKPKTIFATHYHELNEIAEKHERVKNFHVQVKEIKDKVIFMRKLIPGGSEHSFGIHVAQMAGVPNSVVERSKELLALLEDKQDSIQNKDRLAKASPTNMQMSMFEIDDPTSKKIKSELKKIDINATSPMEALMKLNYLKEILSGNK
ncbi:MAG: DNA mismatch repair protein MutS [Bacteroidetes bacterium]|nr:DNA mismatch repair protein MutS [Bacteroidota bacterium]